ncbi:MAG TPA: protein-methionine-sulfoxide reductase heme-binding subunit MsrQ [Acetobacteraceae bacterium]|nr:protein-methionine-sulfoxide reductase heme-binding subunit MsrQ [Acetobacteraceae bacterium]
MNESTGISVATTPRMRSTRRPPARVFWRKAPFRDRSGRISAFKSFTLAACIAPAVWLGWAWQAGALSGRPVTTAMLLTGLWAVRFLLLSLAVTPARMLFNWPRAMLVRRMLGLTAAAYTAAHVVFYIAQQGFAWSFVGYEIVHVFYLAIGMVAVVGLALLAATSTDGMLRRLGRRWKMLHRSIYLLAALSFWHFFLTQKIDVTLAMLPAGLFVWLMLWRAVPIEWQRRLVVLLGISVLAGLLTALGEAGWYAAYSHVPAARVLAADLNLSGVVRPGWWVAADGLLVAAAAIVLRLIAQARRPAAG